MKKLLIACLLVTGWANAQNITFKDPAFKNYLVSNSFYDQTLQQNIKLDADNDGEISLDEAHKLKELSIQDSTIVSIDGIENFINLTNLYFDYVKNITSIDVSTLTNLSKVSIYRSPIVSFFKASDRLEDLYVYGVGLLNNIDFSLYPKLKWFYLHNTEYNSNSIDFSSNNQLESITIDHLRSSYTPTLITPLNLKDFSLYSITPQISVDYSRSLNLTGVRFYDVNVIDLDFSKCLELNKLDLSSLKFLVTLNVSNTKLTDLSLYGLDNLEVLDLSKISTISSISLFNIPKLNTLNFSNNDNLSFLNIYGLSQLTSLNLSNNKKITYISLSDLSQLASLDLSNNNGLFDLYLKNINKLIAIDLSKNIKLKTLNIPQTKISTLDLSNNVELFDLRLNNEIKSLDLANNSKLDTLYTGTGLEYLNLKKGSHLSHITLSKPNTRLYICADDQNIPLIEQSIKDSNLVNVEANSYCSFTPGGLYNTITNKVLFDATGNCTGNNQYLKYTKFSIVDSNGIGYSITNKDGLVQFYKQKGTYTLNPILENPTYFKISPQMVNFNLVDNSGHDTTINFCVTPNGVHKDVEVVLAPYGPARPGFNATYLVTYKNKGNQSLSGDVSIQYNEDVLDFVRSTMSTQTSGLVSTSFLDLKPFEVRVDTLVLRVNSPVDTPAVNINDTLKFVATINPTNDDVTPNDNVFSFNQRVVGAYDPNLITCLEGNELKPTEIGKTLHYTIEFENTGNYPAENIVVVEEIDPKKYDINSIQILNTSHPMKFRVEGNKVEYYFEKIQLGEHKHGNILLKLYSNEELQEGSEVNKQANIYFDYNAPIQTNIEKTVYRDLKASIADLKEDVSINVYPNPGNGLVNVNAAKNIKSIEVYDVNGRVIQTNIVNATQIELHLSDEITGIYFVKVITEEGANVIKYQKN